MCGITGVFSFNSQGASFLEMVDAATTCITSRGPDGHGVARLGPVTLGHRRLAIIDTSEAASQPMHDITKRFTIVFNGEFFNFQEHRVALEKEGVTFQSHSDTEVIIHLYAREGPACLQKINGFFALAIFDAEKQELFVARDRMGIKPLLIFKDDDKFIFASEMKAMLSYGIKRNLDYASLYAYLQLNYVPPPNTMLEEVSKLRAGHYMLIKNKNTGQQIKYYSLPVVKEYADIPALQQEKKLFELMEQSVQKRLISDVPLGAFLSGGIDSSIITGLAARHTKHLNTFSVGFKDHPHFDETHFAKLVSKKHHTEHTIFSLTDEDLYEHLFEILDYIDEPFADSSAIAVYILSQRTARHVKVALSGDGADEMFGGYNKHRAEMFIREKKLLTRFLRMSEPLARRLPQSRNSTLANKVRQISRFSAAASLNNRERYWRWCSFASEEEAAGLLPVTLPARNLYNERKYQQVKNISPAGDLNEVLRTDMELVLQGDMLTKVDLMSMANSLEVRVPFLDYTVVDYSFNMKPSIKTEMSSGKKILKSAFKELLPEEILNRPKKGFEVPLLQWFRTGLKSLINDDLLSEQFVKEQKIFNPDAVKALREQLFSANPGDIHARIWGLIVFQYWWKKHMQ